MPPETLKERNADGTIRLFKFQDTSGELSSCARSGMVTLVQDRASPGGQDAPSIPQGSVTGRGWACTAQPFPQYLQHFSPSRDYTWDTDLPWRRAPSPCSKPGLFMALPVLTDGELGVRSGFGSVSTSPRCWFMYKGQRKSGA